LSKETDVDKRIEQDMLLLREIANNPDKYYNPIDENDPKLNGLLNMFNFINNHFDA
jgi:hypothetical protein